MKRLLTFLVLLAIGFVNVNAYQWLRVGDPAGTWSNWVNGTIEDVNYTIEAEGLYFKVDMHIAFSAANVMPDASSDSLEIQYGFTLPTNSTIIDANLLIGDEWQNAWILDRRQARAIYEGIVQRRQDPMILYKNYGDNYYMQIFPMAKAGTREIKLTFIVPANFEGDKMYLQLPINDYANFTKLGKADVINVDVMSAGMPELAEAPDVSPESISGDESGERTWRFSFDSGTSNSATVMLGAPGEGGTMFSHCNTNGEGYYELAFSPRELLKLDNEHKYLFVIDHDPNSTFYWWDNGERKYVPVDQDGVLDAIRKFALTSLVPADQFCIQYTNGEVILLSDDYVPANPENINKAFDGLQNASFTHEKLSKQIIASTQFVQDNGGDIILISNNSDYRYVADSARAVLKEVLLEVDSLAPVNMVDYSYIYYYNYYWGEDISFYASSYFLSEIARITDGQYVSVHNTNSISKALTELNKQTEGELQFFKAELKPQGGFTMGDYVIQNSNANNYWYRGNNAEAQVYLNDHIRMIGKYMGQAPFVLSIRGFYNGELVSYEKPLEDLLTETDCSFMAKAWVSKYIADQESGWLNVNQKNNVVNMSIRHRVLSNQTAFLALEPGMDSLLIDCPDCGEPQNGGNDGGRSDLTTSEGLAGGPEGELISTNDTYASGYMDGAKVACDTVYDMAYGSGYKEGIRDAANAIDDVVEINIFTASPNPFVNNVKLLFDVGSSNDTYIKTVEIVDVLGRSIKIFKTTGDPNRFEVNWDGSDSENMEVPTGNYFVVLTTVASKHTFRIVKE